MVLPNEAFFWKEEEETRSRIRPGNAVPSKVSQTDPPKEWDFCVINADVELVRLLFFRQKQPSATDNSSNLACQKYYWNSLSFFSLRKDFSLVFCGYFSSWFYQKIRQHATQAGNFNLRSRTRLRSWFGSSFLILDFLPILGIELCL